MRNRTRIRRKNISGEAAKLFYDFQGRDSCVCACVCACMVCVSLSAEGGIDKRMWDNNLSPCTCNNLIGQVSPVKHLRLYDWET